MAALASLTADYIDSDEEEEHEEAKPEAPIGSAQRFLQDNVTPSSVGSNPTSAKSTPTKKMRLVSYTEEGGEEEDSDRDDDSEHDAESRKSGEGNQGASDDAEVVPMDLDSENEGENETGADDVKDKERAAETQGDSVKVEAWSGGVKLPPEPPGQCNPRLQEKINALHKKKMETNYDMNAMIQKMKSFRNPSIYQKLINYCNITESGTNFPKELYDGHLFGKESYYEELAKVQMAEIDRREKASNKKRLEAGNTKNSQVSTSGSSKRLSEDAGSSHPTKRKSKWDQTAPQMVAATAVVGRPATKAHVPLPSVPVPQVVSAGAAKIISAFGPLKK